MNCRSREKYLQSKYITKDLYVCVHVCIDDDDDDDTIRKWAKAMNRHFTEGCI